MRLALIGLGHMGRKHLQKLILLASQFPIEQVDVYDPYIESLPFERADLPRVRLVQTQLKGQFDGILIAAPTSTHEDWMETLIESQQTRFIFVEKPAGLRVDRLKRIAKQAAERGIDVRVGQIERFNPVLDQLAERLKADWDYLHIERTAFSYKRLADPILWDLGIHDWDIWWALMRQLPSMSLGWQHSYQDHGLFFQLEHENRRISGFWCRYIPERRRYWLFVNQTVGWKVDLAQPSVWHWDGMNWAKIWQLDDLFDPLGHQLGDWLALISGTLGSTRLPRLSEVLPIMEWVSQWDDRLRHDVLASCRS